jgi:hypothetical protein
MKYLIVRQRSLVSSWSEATPRFAPAAMGRRQSSLRRMPSLVAPHSTPASGSRRRRNCSANWALADSPVRSIAGSCQSGSRRRSARASRRPCRAFPRGPSRQICPTGMSSRTLRRQSSTPRRTCSRAPQVCPPSLARRPTSRLAATLPPIASMAMNALPLTMFSPPKVLVCTRKHGKANGRMPAWNGFWQRWSGGDSVGRAFAVREAQTAATVRSPAVAFAEKQYLPILPNSPASLIEPSAVALDRRPGHSHSIVAGGLPEIS